MFAENNQLIIRKGFFTFAPFYKSLRRDEKNYPDSNFVIHMRIATSGEIDFDNCHPFSVNRKLAVMHNGIFSNLTDAGKLSDTRNFVNSILKLLPKNFLNSVGTLNLLDKYCIAEFSKLVFLDNRGDFTIINESAGEWVNGIWFSNDTYVGPEWIKITPDDKAGALDFCDYCNKTKYGYELTLCNGALLCSECVQYAACAK